MPINLLIEGGLSSNNVCWSQPLIWKGLLILSFYVYALLLGKKQEVTFSDGCSNLCVILDTHKMCSNLFYLQIQFNRYNHFHCPVFYKCRKNSDILLFCVFCQICWCIQLLSFFVETFRSVWKMWNTVTSSHSVSISYEMLQNYCIVLFLWLYIVFFRMCERVKQECALMEPQDVMWKADMYCAALITGVWERGQICSDVTSSNIAEV